MRALAVLLFLAGTAFSPAAWAQYVDGTILPNHVTAEERDRALADFYKEWKSVFLLQMCGEGRYVVDMAGGGHETYGGSADNTLTVSEAHGCGMLIAVLMAEFDPDAQTIFDGMVAYWHDHPAASSPGLLAWNQLRDCTDAKEVGGDATATDGDLDLAYALLLADRRWGSAGAIDYRAEAEKSMAAILDVETDDGVLLIGDWAKGNGLFAATTRSSDFTMSHFAAFADASEDRRWLALRDDIYDIVDAVASKDTGLVPDFIVEAASSPQPAPPDIIEGATDGMYSWNACRYPWRVALDYLINGDERAKAAVERLTAWAKTSTGGDPRRFLAGYRLDGSPAPESYENALAYVAPLGVAAMVDGDNQDWLNAIWDAVIAKQVADDDYYGNTLKLLTMITMSGHWQSAGQG